jgi:hypothetical protein
MMVPKPIRVRALNHRLSLRLWSPPSPSSLGLDPLIPPVRLDLAPAAQCASRPPSFYSPVVCMLPLFLFELISGTLHGDALEPLSSRPHNFGSSSSDTGTSGLVIDNVLANNHYNLMRHNFEFLRPITICFGAVL